MIGSSPIGQRVPVETYGSRFIVTDTIPGLLDCAALKHGDAIAVATPTRTLTYAQLRASAATLARGLVTIGVGKGTRVALLAGDTPLFVESVFAAAQLGALLVPISTLAAPSELAHILRHSDAQILLAERRYLGKDYGELVARALPGLVDEPSNRGLRLTGTPYLRSIWFDDSDGIAWAESHSRLTEWSTADRALDDDFLEDIKQEVHAADLAVVIYTSGSTAMPKAVVHTHGSIVRQARTAAGIHFVHPGERVVCALPMFWAGGLSMMLETVTNGGCLILPESVAPEVVAGVLRDFSADRFHGWPAQRGAMRKFMESQAMDFAGIHGLRDEVVDDAPVRPEQIAGALGMTESFGPHSALPVGALLPDHRLGAYGPAIGGHERRVVDAGGSGALVPPGVLGELQLRGDALMDGYYKKERSDVFTPDGFFGTHDLVRIEPDGFMYFEGRTDDMLKTKGANVSRLEVEAALRSIAGVTAAIVCGLPDPEVGQRIVAAVVPASDELTPLGLKAAVSKHLAGYKVPSEIRLISEDQLAFTGTGKIHLSEMTKRMANWMGSDSPADGRPG
jgi:acyl-CoA synthetase (AMP-forming)/AMP-acid ligase II